MYDIEQIFSWTPKEFEFLILGARHKQIDNYEFMAQQAMANAYATNAKRPKATSIFNAKRARRMLETGEKPHEEIEHMIELNEKFKGFKPDFRPKKGG